MALKEKKISVTTIADGSGTTNDDDVIKGRIEKLIIGVDGATPTLTLSGRDTGEVYYTKTSQADAIVYPLKQAVDAADGSVLTLDGTRKLVKEMVIWERLKLVSASGGNTKTHTITVIYDDLA